MSFADFTKIVVPIDFSDPSLDALRRALELCGDASKLHVVHVLPQLHPMEPGVVWSEQSDAERESKAEAAVAKRLEEPGFSGAHTHAGIGDPGHGIVEIADEIGADLIIIASHGYTGLKHLFLGSVAERVVRHAHCPVLVMRS